MRTDPCKFCITHETMNTLEAIFPDFEFVPDVSRLNDQKLKVNLL
jgi:hypothetical protein